MFLYYRIREMIILFLNSQLTGETSNPSNMNCNFTSAPTTRNIEPPCSETTNMEHGGSMFRLSSQINYNSQLFTVLGNGIASLMLEIPVRYMTHLSNPSPNPEWWVEPYLRRSK